MRAGWLLALLALAACAEPPQTDVGVVASGNDISVVPTVSTNVGGVRIGANPYGARIGTSIGGIGIGVGL
jgi:hypothetical protein